MEGAGISALPDAAWRTVGLGELPDDPVALLEARRRQQIQGAGYDPAPPVPDWMQRAPMDFGMPTIAARMRAAEDAMRAGDKEQYQKLATDLSVDLGGFLGSIKAVRNPIRAYHGSPHDFDKFRMDRIGTGEGAQAYGHGLYFAEREGVARSYRDALSAPARVNVNQVGNQDPQQLAIPLFRSLGRRNGAMQARKLAEYYPGQRDAYLKAADIIERGDPYAGVSPGRMYEVNIHADPDRFLDWDALVDEQPKAVMDAMRKTDWWPWTSERIQDAGAAHGSNPIGQHIVRDLTEDAGKDGATEMLRAAGLPGIKYLDGGSRAAGDGSRNYVVFDEKLIEILRKYGLVPPVAAAAGIGALGETEDGL